MAFAIFAVIFGAKIANATSPEVPVSTGISQNPVKLLPRLCNSTLEPVPAVNTDLFRRVYALPGVENRPSIISLPGARGLWLSDKLPLVHPEVIIAGREFAHIHPDGSLHASLPPKRAREAVQAGWAIRHPWAGQREGWEGIVMLYTPQSMEELDMTFQLIVDSYNFVTGQNIQATDYSG